MNDPLYELIMNRNPVIKTREYGWLTVNITGDGRIRIKWGDKAITISPEKAEKFFAGCIMLCELARRLGDDMDWGELWSKKMHRTRKAKAKPKVKEVREAEEEEEGEEGIEEDVVEVF